MKFTADHATASVSVHTVGLYTGMFMCQTVASPYKNTYKMVALITAARQFQNAVF